MADYKGGTRSDCACGSEVDRGPDYQRSASPGGIEPPVALIDPATIDTSRVLVDREGLRLGNPQRFEMEQLTAIVAIDPDEHLIIGYKDIAPDEFWVRGHMPDYPLMPGVLLIEAMAQTSGWLVIGLTKFTRMPFLVAVKDCMEDPGRMLLGV